MGSGRRQPPSEPPSDSSGHKRPAGSQGQRRRRRAESAEDEDRERRVRRRVTPASSNEPAGPSTRPTLEPERNGTAASAATTPTASPPDASIPATSPAVPAVPFGEPGPGPASRGKRRARDCGSRGCDSESITPPRTRRHTVPGPVPRNAGQRWTAEANYLLQTMRHNNTPYSAIALRLGKTPLASRLHLHNLKKRATKQKGKKAPPPKEMPSGPVPGSLDQYGHVFGGQAGAPQHNGAFTFNHEGYPIAQQPEMARPADYLPRPASQFRSILPAGRAAPVVAESSRQAAAEGARREAAERSRQMLPEANSAFRNASDAGVLNRDAFARYVYLRIEQRGVHFWPSIAAETGMSEDIVREAYYYHQRVLSMGFEQQGHQYMQDPSSSSSASAYAATSMNEREAASTLSSMSSRGRASDPFNIDGDHYRTHAQYPSYEPIIQNYPPPRDDRYGAVSPRTTPAVMHSAPTEWLERQRSQRVVPVMTAPPPAPPAAREHAYAGPSYQNQPHVQRAYAGPSEQAYAQRAYAGPSYQDQHHIQHAYPGPSVQDQHHLQPAAFPTYPVQHQTQVRAGSSAPAQAQTDGTDAAEKKDDDRQDSFAQRERMSVANVMNPPSSP